MFHLRARSWRDRFASMATLAMLIILVGVTVGGCSLFQSGELNPPQQAYALNKEYQAVARAALGCKAVPKCWELAGDKIQAADNAAFAYVEETTQAAKEWVAAPEEGEQSKEVVKTSFDHLLGIAKSAIAKLTSLL